MSSSNTYYVYAYLREDFTPYYIGKGTGVRAWRHKPSEVQPPVDRSRVIIVENNLTNVGSLAIERRLIRWYGRIDLGTGILRNMSPGGDGGPGAKPGCNKGKVFTEELKKKLSDKRLDGIRSGKIVAWNKGVKQSLNLSCPHCGTICQSKWTFSRWHLDNCPKKKAA